MTRFIVVMAAVIVMASGGYCATVVVSPDNMQGWDMAVNRNGLAYFTRAGALGYETNVGFPSGSGAFYAICTGGGTGGTIAAAKTPDTVWLGLDTYNGQPLGGDGGVFLDQIKTLEYTAYVSDGPTYISADFWKYPRQPITLQFVITNTLGGAERKCLWFRPWLKNGSEPQGSGYGGDPLTQLGKWITYDCMNCSYVTGGVTRTDVAWNEPISNAIYHSWAEVCAAYPSWWLVGTAPVGDPLHSAGWDLSTEPAGATTATATGMAMNFEVGARKFQYNGIWGATKGINWFPESIYFKGYLDTFTFGVDYGGETGVVETTYDFEPAAAATAPKVVALNNRSLVECDYDPEHGSTNGRVGYAAIFESASGFWKLFNTRAFGMATNVRQVQEGVNQNYQCCYFELTDGSSGISIPYTVRVRDADGSVFANMQNADMVGVTADVRRLPWGLNKNWYLWSCASNLYDYTYPF